MVQNHIYGSKPYLWFKTIFMVQNHIYGSKPYSWSITIFMFQNHIYKVNIRAWAVLSDSFHIQKLIELLLCNTTVQKGKVLKSFLAFSLHLYFGKDLIISRGNIISKKAAASSNSPLLLSLTRFQSTQSDIKYLICGGLLEVE